MNGRYLFQVGDEVRHGVDGTVGKIVELNTDENGEPFSELNPENPWYHIKWEGEDSIGWEHENSLVPGFVNPRPSLFMSEVWRDNREYWEEILNRVS